MKLIYVLLSLLALHVQADESYQRRNAIGYWQFQFNPSAAIVHFDGKRLTYCQRFKNQESDDRFLACEPKPGMSPNFRYSPGLDRFINLLSYRDSIDHVLLRAMATRSYLTVDRQSPDQMILELNGQTFAMVRWDLPAGMTELKPYNPYETKGK